jgi:glycosyltransferase involved in cell wall biosynthesis
MQGLGGRPPTVVYIAGSGRSGSTLVERVLGEIPGLTNVGELLDLARRTAPNDERCGCGLPFGECPFWAKVGERAFGGWETGQLAGLERLRGRVARQRHLPKLLAMAVAGRGFRADVAKFGASYAAIYQAVADTDGTTCVVDASKVPAQALALARAGIDIRVVHLVRDARGVAYSLGKQVARPHAVKAAEQMWGSLPLEAAGRWLAIQSEAELLRRCGIPVARVLYGDFVRRPRPVIEQALTRLGLPPSRSDLAHIGDGQVALGRSHGLSGNPSRFTEGEVRLHADEAWRRHMSRRDQIVVTAITLPLLVRYRQFPGPGEQSRGETAPSRDQGNVPAMVSHSGHWPLVSVIMPTRGRPEMVRAAIASVVAQDYAGDIECLVVHDQEPLDESLKELGTEHREIRVISNTEHSPGLAGARNSGLDLARGEFIATCDDDDTWLPGKIRLQVERMLSEPDLLAVGGGLRLLLPDDKVQEWPGRAERISYNLLLRNRVKELHSSTLMMRREAYAKAGQYDEQLPHGYAEDYDWVLRVARVGNLGVVRQPVANIRKNAPSWYRGVAETACPGLEHMLAKHTDFTTSRRGHARILGQIAFAKSALGQRGPALRYAARALVRWPVSPYPYIALAHATTGVPPERMLRLARLMRRGMA